tara:strand:- start:1093 stop:1335 length:243 start_codon:yes stop_codon:yes gene_type:complete
MERKSQRLIGMPRTYIFAPPMYRIVHCFAMSYLIPPQNFGIVEMDLYRSGQPNRLNFPFLERLSLRKIIYLAPDEPSSEL